MLNIVLLFLNPSNVNLRKNFSFRLLVLVGGSGAAWVVDVGSLGWSGLFPNATSVNLRAKSTTPPDVLIELEKWLPDSYSDLFPFLSHH